MFFSNSGAKTTNGNLKMFTLVRPNKLFASSLRRDVHTVFLVARTTVGPTEAATEPSTSSHGNQPTQENAVDPGTRRRKCKFEEPSDDTLECLRPRVVDVPDGPNGQKQPNMSCSAMFNLGGVGERGSGASASLRQRTRHADPRSCP